MSNNVLYDIATTIIQEVQREFEAIHLTGQLMDSARIERDGDDILIKIDPLQYNFKAFRTRGVIIPYSDRSYASYVNDVSGGFSGTHYMFIMDAIWNAVYANGCDIVSTNITTN